MLILKYLNLIRLDLFCEVGADWTSYATAKIGDEFSGALLASELSPQPQWQAIVPGDARELFRHGFGRWGLPGGIRIDNGHPWGLNSGLPPDLA